MSAIELRSRYFIISCKYSKINIIILNVSEDYLDYSQENNQNHTNLPSSLTVNLEVVPQKQETVIISTEEARNMLNMEQIKGKLLAKVSWTCATYF